MIPSDPNHLENNILFAYNEARETYLDLFLEYEKLVSVEIPYYEAQFVDEMGGLFYKLFSYELKEATTKLEVDFITQALKEDRAPDLEVIRHKVAEIFEKQHEKLKQQEDKLDTARAFKENFSQVKLSSVTEKIYRELMAFYHPDINPHLTSKEFRLFTLIKTQFDLHAWDDLQELYYHLMPKDLWEPTDPELAEKEYPILRRRTERLQSEVKRLYNNYPLKYRNLLHNNNELKEKKETLKKEIRFHQVRYKFLHNKLMVLLLYLRR